MRLPIANLNHWVKIVAPMYVNEYLRLVPSRYVQGSPAPSIIIGSTWFFASYIKSSFRLLGIFWSTIYINLLNPDIVHETYFSPVYLFRRRVKKVLTIYDMIHEKFPSEFASNDKTANNKRRAALSADHIICISESTRRDVIDILGVKPDKTSVVYLGFNFFSPSLHVRSELNRYCKTPYLLYVGQRSGYKNFERFMRAYGGSKRLSQSFNIVAFGGGALTFYELALIDSLGINQDAIFQLSGNDQLLGYLYKNASAFIYPSLYEGFGIPPLEAMSHDCPVVCSLSSSIPEVVGDAGEFFDPTNIEAIAAAIENVVFDLKRARELKLLGRRRLSKFSWEKCAQETEKIYMQLIRDDEKCYEH